MCAPARIEMYNVKGPSKIVAKTTRRGISQNIDAFREHPKGRSVENDDNEFGNDPRPVFQSALKPNRSHAKETLTPEHKEMISYIKESWNSVCLEVNQPPPNNPDGERSIIYYEDDPCPLLKDFKPFDLESWWGKRLFTYLTNSVTSES